MKIPCCCFLLAVLILATMPFAHAATVGGIIYHDGNKSARSHYEQSIDETDVPLPNVGVTLLGSDGEMEATTGEDGVFSFDDIAPGTYLLLPKLPEYRCTSANRSGRIFEAVKEGGVHITAIGDSISVDGDNPFPERIAGYFSSLADTTLDNLAVGGSTTVEWLPGADTGYFDEQLLPLLPDTDLITITLGVNDPAIYLPEEPFELMDVIQAFLDNPEYLLDVPANLYTIINAARDINPDVDVAYVIYPNFGNSTYMTDEFGLFTPIISMAIDYAFSIVRWSIWHMEDVIIADALGALGDELIDDYLVDPVHPGDVGHQHYADVIFTCLGGVVIDETRLGEQRLYAFDAPDLVPTPPDDDTDDDTAPDDDSDDDQSDDDTVAEPDDDDSNADETPADSSDDGSDDDDGACCG